MIRLGPFAIVRLDSLAAPEPAIDERRRVMVERMMMTALIATDAYLTEDGRAPIRHERKRAVCEQVVAAIGEGLKLGF